MSTFIDLLGNDIWSDADITNRTEAIVRAQFSAIDETVLNRKVSGAGMGVYTLTADDMAEIQRFGAVTQAAAALGVQARADMALLQSALDYETATRRLSMPAFAGPKTRVMTDDAGGECQQDNPDYLSDQAEREAALDVVSSASQITLHLVGMRNPQQEKEALAE